jgi:hypothetical protein
MTAATAPPSGDSFLTTPDFSLVLGGPLYQLWRGTRLADDAMEMLQRRIIAMVAVAWVPLLLLSIHPDDIVLGGGNAKKLKGLPKGCRGDNANAFIGGFR